MKPALVAVTTFGIALSTVLPGYAEDPEAIQRLLETRSCVRCDLRDANLQGQNLRRVNLRGANLEGANLRRADLSGADLSNANLREASLRSANLRNADLSNADLRDANLRGTDLTDADLFGVSLRGTNIDEAQSSSFSQEINRMFRNLTGRNLDSYRAREYVRELADGRSRTQIRRDIVRSNETRDAIGRLYESVLGRTADAAGLQTWMRYLESENRSLFDLRRELASSSEARATINQLYRDILGRDADATGMRGWLEQLQRGRSLAEIRSRIVNSEEAKRR